jgi:hypothetical protein
MRILRKLIKFGKKSPQELYAIGRYILIERGWYLPRLGDDRTAYVIGLCGSGRLYLKELIKQNIGKRAKYLIEGIHLPPGPTSVIFTGHATIRHVSHGQSLPEVTIRILEAARLGIADLIFVHRHPLDSLLTNWVWMRAYIRTRIDIIGISTVYKNTEDFCADLEQNFSEFKSFAEGDPDFYAAAPPGPRFLSFSEFVEETELHIQSATLALRLEDSMIDPFKEFSKVLAVMSVGLDLDRSCVVPPKTRPYRHLEVKEKVPRFRDFIEGLDAETKRRIEKIGYNL